MSNILKRIAVFGSIILIFSKGNLSAQVAKYVVEYDNMFDNPQQPSTKYTLYQYNRNEFQAILNVLFVGYKKIVSVQDANHCQFYPSCSVYALEAIRKKGVFLGMLQGFDRLSRCNGQNTEQYKKLPDSDQLLDPVK